MPTPFDDLLAQYTPRLKQPWEQAMDLAVKWQALADRMKDISNRA